MWPVMIFLVLVVGFYWFAACFTVWAWFNFIISLCQCRFIRASLWWNAGTAMLLWWTDKWESWNAFLPGACVFVGLGALGTFARYHSKRKAMQAIPTMPTWTPPK